MYILNEGDNVKSIPKNIKRSKNSEKIIMDVVLQTVNDINRNGRMYKKEVVQEGIDMIKHRFDDQDLIGELDHPVDSDASRQVTCLYNEASHLIKEVGWDGNKLIATIETLCATQKGRTLRDLALKDRLPIGFSFRGMADVKNRFENGVQFDEIVSPLYVLTWDAVSYPSHKEARMIRYTENVSKHLHSKLLCEKGSIVQHNGMICTKEGYCFLPNDFDELVERHVIELISKY